MEECRKLIPLASHIPIRTLLGNLDQTELHRWLEDIAEERKKIKATIRELEKKLATDLYRDLCWYSCIPEDKEAS